MPLSMRHRDVGHDHVGAQLARRLHHRAAVLDDAGELELLREQALQSLGDDAMVVGQQDAGLARSSFTPAPTRPPWCRAPACSRCRARRAAGARARACWPGPGSRGRASAPGSKPLPLSLTASCKPAVARRQQHGHRARAAVARGVAQRFLRDAEQAQRRLAGHRRPARRAHPPPPAASPWRATRSHSARSASTSPRSSSTEGCRRYDSACTSSLRRTRSLRIVRTRRPPRAALEPAGVDGEAREALRQVVVQLAREAAALVLVRGEQAAAQADGLLFGTPAPRALEQQRRDQAGLQQHDRRRPPESAAGAAPTARAAGSAPRRRAAAATRECPSAASSRQSKAGALGSGARDSRRALCLPQHARGQLRRDVRLRANVDVRSAHDALAELVVEDAEDRRARHSRMAASARSFSCSTPSAPTANK